MRSVRGLVEHGDAMGRQLGFPTANLALEDDLVEDGVWVGEARWNGGQWILAAVSTGRRRTFYSETGPRLLEAHLIDFEGDLYGVQLEVRLLTKIRSQLRFVSAEALINQMRLDVQFARRWQAVRQPEKDPSRAAHPRSEAADGCDATVPPWALLRVQGALGADKTQPANARDLKELARRTGLSKGLVGRCLRQMHPGSEHALAGPLADPQTVHLDPSGGDEVA